MHKTIFGMAALPLLMARLACAAPAAPIPVTIAAAHSPAAAAVQQYLADRTAGRYAKAYGLLSTATQGMLPLDQFQAAQNFPKDPTADGMTPLFTCPIGFLR